jgi:ParB family transcriptional regulator, chromosome partitioning protein
LVGGRDAEKEFHVEHFIPRAKREKGRLLMSTVNPKNKPRLGRGLSSLMAAAELPVEVEVNPPAAEPMPTPAAPPVMTAGPIDIPVADVFPNPHQPRRQFNEQSLQALAASIKSSGLVQPVVVRQRAGERGYELIAGERRLRAVKLAGLSVIPAIIRQASAYEQAQMALIENIQREDLNPVDRALAYRTLMDQLGLTQAELAVRLGEDRSSIGHHLRLLDLAGPVRDLVTNGLLSLGHGKLLATVTNELQQMELAQRVVKEDLSVRTLERILQEAVAPPPATAPGAPPAASAHLQDLEKSLTSQLGMRVQVRAGSKKGKGRLVVHYGSLDEFDTLLERLGVKPD